MTRDTTQIARMCFVFVVFVSCIKHQNLEMVQMSLDARILGQYYIEWYRSYSKGMFEVNLFESIPQVSIFPSLSQRHWFQSGIFLNSVTWHQLNLRGEEAAVKVHKSRRPEDFHLLLPCTKTSSFLVLPECIIKTRKWSISDPQPPQKGQS